MNFSTFFHTYTCLYFASLKEQDRYRVKTACERLNLIWNIVFTESPESKQVYAENQVIISQHKVC